MLFLDLYTPDYGNRLSHDEFVYELKWRGFTDVGTVNQMRKCLRRALRHERMGRSFSYPTYDVPFEEESADIDKEIIEIGVLAKEARKGTPGGASLKLETKIAHIFGRVDRLSTTDPTVMKARSAFLQRILDIEGDVIDSEPVMTVADPPVAIGEFEQALLENSKSDAHGTEVDDIQTAPGLSGLQTS